MADTTTDLAMPAPALAAYYAGDTVLAIRLTLATRLTEVADELMVLRGLDDTDAGQEAYATAEATLREKVRALFS